MENHLQIRAQSDSIKLTTVPKEFPTLYEGEKNPRFYWWGGKRLSSYEPSVANIRRPIRVPFNSWGGKRGREYPRSNVNSQMKRSKLAFDRIDQDMSMDGLDGVKRMAEMGKGGQEEFLFPPEETKVLGITKGQLKSMHLGSPCAMRHRVSKLRNDRNACHFKSSVFVGGKYCST